MSTNVTVSNGEGSTQVTVITGEGSTSYTVSAGSRGPTGATGATGATGPNTITAATTTPLVGFLSGNAATVTASTSATFVSGSQAIFDPGSQANFDNFSETYFDSGSQAYFGSGSQAYFDSGSTANFVNGTIKLASTNFTSSLNFVAPTSAKTITLPDATGTVALTDDPRFTDARTPLAHTHVVSDIVSIASHHLIGRHAGSTGAAQEVNVGNGIEFQGSGIRRSALTGDVTATAGSNSTTIANDSVTNAKLANVATATIKGRTTAGTGDPEDLTLGTGIEFSGSTIQRSALTGDITASAGSNATTLAATIAGAKTLSGQLQLTGQSATDANSAMTRGLGDARYFLHSTNYITVSQTKANNADFAGASTLTTIPRITCAFLPSSIRVRACIMFTTAPVAFTTANFDFILYSTNIGNANMSTGTPLTIVPTSVTKVSGLEQYIIIAEVSAADISTKYGSAFSTHGVLNFLNGCDLKNKTGASLTTVATNAGFIALEIYR